MFWLSNSPTTTSHELFENPWALLVERERERPKNPNSHNYQASEYWTCKQPLVMSSPRIYELFSNENIQKYVFPLWSIWNWHMRQVGHSFSSGSFDRTRHSSFVLSPHLGRVNNEEWWDAHMFLWLIICCIWKIIFSRHLMIC